MRLPAVLTPASERPELRTSALAHEGRWTGGVSGPGLEAVGPAPGAESAGAGPFKRDVRGPMLTYQAPMLRGSPDPHGIGLRLDALGEEFRPLMQPRRFGGAAENLVIEGRDKGVRPLARLPRLPNHLRPWSWTQRRNSTGT